MKLTEQLNEALGKPDSRQQAEQLKQFLSKSEHKKGSKEEQDKIDEWFNSKDFDDNDTNNIMKMFESVDEAKSHEASMVLKLMDSEYEELGFEKLVDIIATAMGKDKKKLAKELDQFI